MYAVVSSYIMLKLECYGLYFCCRAYVISFSYAALKATDLHEMTNITKQKKFSGNSK